MKPTDDTKALILTGDGYTLTIAPEAEKLKQELLTAAQAITVIESDEDVAKANSEIARLARVRLDVEKTRVEVKAPVLEITRKIDGAAKDYAGALTAEEDRLTKLIGNFAAEQRRKIQEAQRERERLEAEKLRQQQEAEKKAAEAERLRKEAEQRRFEAEKPAEKRAATIMEKQAEAAATEAQQATQAAAGLGQSSLAKALSIATTRTVDNVVFDLDYEVTDLAALFAFSADLVELVPRRAEILKLVNVVGKTGDIPGVKIKEVPRVKKGRI